MHRNGGSGKWSDWLKVYNQEVMWSVCPTCSWRPRISCFAFSSHEESALMGGTRTGYARNPEALWPCNLGYDLCPCAFTEMPWELRGQPLSGNSVQSYVFSLGTRPALRRRFKSFVNTLWTFEFSGWAKKSLFIPLGLLSSSCHLDPYRARFCAVLLAVFLTMTSEFLSFCSPSPWLNVDFILLVFLCLMSD